MKNKYILRSLAICLAVGGMLAACGGGESQGPTIGDSKLLADGEACPAAWISTTAYSGGARVSYSGKPYTAAYWSLGVNPSTNNGPVGSGQPWNPGFACIPATTTTTKTSTTTTKSSVTTTTMHTACFWNGSDGCSTTTKPTTTTTSTKGTTTTTLVPSCSTYVAGTAYAAGKTVANAGGYYTCTVAGWCSLGASAYEPGVGWAWSSAWTTASASACTPPASPIAFSTVDVNQYSGISTAQTHVVGDAITWTNLWSAHQKNRIPQPALPAINFAQKTVLGVFLGARSNGCYSVKIEKVYQTGEKVIAEYKETVPSAGAICTLAITSPSHLVVIDRPQYAVQFVRK